MKIKLFYSSLFLLFCVFAYTIGILHGLDQLRNMQTIFIYNYKDETNAVDNAKFVFTTTSLAEAESSVMSRLKWIPDPIVHMASYLIGIDLEGKKSLMNSSPQDIINDVNSW